MKGDLYANVSARIVAQLQFKKDRHCRSDHASTKCNRAAPAHRPHPTAHARAFLHDQDPIQTSTQRRFVPASNALPQPGGMIGFHRRRLWIVSWMPVLRFAVQGDRSESWPKSAISSRATLA